jgi:hypothetical protein
MHIKGFEDFLNENYISEGEMNPVKKVMNSIFKKNGIKKVITHTTSVRGFTRTEGSGYNYEYSGLVTFHRIPAEKVKLVADQMAAAGVKIRTVRDGSIEFDQNNLGATNESEKPIEIGSRVKAKPEYGGKTGTVEDISGSWIIVKHGKDTKSYHSSDLKVLSEANGISGTLELLS